MYRLEDKGFTVSQKDRLQARAELHRSRDPYSLQGVVDFTVVKA